MAPRNQEPPWTGSLKWPMLIIHTATQMREMTWRERQEKDMPWDMFKKLVFGCFSLGLTKSARMELYILFHGLHTCINVCQSYPPWTAALRTRPVSAAEASSPARWLPSGHESCQSQLRHRWQQRYQWLYQQRCWCPEHKFQRDLIICQNVSCHKDIIQVLLLTSFNSGSRKT